MDIVNKIDPVLILAVVAIIFALLNIFLWLMVWRIIYGKQSRIDKKELYTNITSIGKQLDESMERNLRLEDQLWGVLDRFKELEDTLNQIKTEVSIKDSNLLDDNEEHIVESKDEYTSDFNKDLNDFKEDFNMVEEDTDEKGKDEEGNNKEDSESNAGEDNADSTDKDVNDSEKL